MENTLITVSISGDHDTRDTANKESSRKLTKSRIKQERMKTIIENNAQFLMPSASNVNRSSGKTGAGNQGSHRNMDTKFHDFSLTFNMIPWPRKLRKGENISNYLGQIVLKFFKKFQKFAIYQPLCRKIFLNSRTF